jgi:cytochrome c oxidase subunit 3/cytochrome o ubiquinol oxidase subunit 3
MTANTSPLPTPPPVAHDPGLNPAQWGMLSFLLSEVAFFSTLVVAYAAFFGRDVVGPTPAEALSLPLAMATTICLLSSSVVIHAAELALARGQQRTFCALWLATIALGVAFLLGTAYEWHALLVEKQLTISRNLFGTTYYTLVGFHGLHVTGGVVAMLVVLGLALGRAVTHDNATSVQLIAWYWHFVDAVWIVVFVVVYVTAKTGGL